MNCITIRKRDGSLVDIECDTPMSIAELMGAVGEDGTGPADAMLGQLVELVGTLKAQAAAKPPVINLPATAAAPAAKLDWKRATLKITKFDGHGRIEEMILDRIF